MIDMTVQIDGETVVGAFFARAEMEAAMQECSRAIIAGVKERFGDEVPEQAQGIAIDVACAVAPKLGFEIVDLQETGPPTKGQ